MIAIRHHTPPWVLLIEVSLNTNTLLLIVLSTWFSFDLGYINKQKYSFTQVVTLTYNILSLYTYIHSAKHRGNQSMSA